MAKRNRELVLGSDPDRAETMISRASLVNSRPRAAALLA
jgi:hypothetical protein